MQNPLIRSAAIIVIFIGTIVILYYGRDLLIPLAFGAVFAILLDPVYEKLMSWNVNRYVSLLASVLLIVLVLLGIMGLVGWQISQVSKDWPQIKEKLTERVEKGQQYVADQFNIPPEKQKSQLKDSLSSLKGKATGYLGGLVGILTALVLMLVYTFLFLMQKERFRKFVMKYTTRSNKGDAREVLAEISEVSRQYMIGKLIVVVILTVIYIIGFLIGGIKFAILLAIIAGILSIVPYLGNIIGGGIAILMALVTGGGLTGVLIIVGVMTLAQALETYILEPMIIGDRVGLNAFSTIFSVIAFTVLWGVAGAILAIPIVAIAKSIFDHTDMLEPLGYLLGDEKDKG